VRRFRSVLLIAIAFAACDSEPPSVVPKGSASITPTPTSSLPKVVSCSGLRVPFNREVNTNLDREGGLLTYSYYVPRFERDRHVTIRYRDDVSCRRNPGTRRLIQHVGAGREIVGCLDVPEQPPAGMTRVELWFGDSTDQSARARSLIVYRDIPKTEAIAAATLRAWIDGPTNDEEEAGAYASAPEGTELLGVEVDTGTAIVDLNSKFERAGLGTTYEGAILERLAGTLTQFNTIDRGLLMIEGRFKEAYMGHGFIVDENHPLLRPERRRYRVAPICGEERT